MNARSLTFSAVGAPGRPTGAGPYRLATVGAVFCALMLVLALAASGCANLTPQQAAGKSLVTIAQTVDAGMTAWAQWVVAKRGTATPVSADAETRVRTAYERYQAAMALARTAYVTAGSSADQTALATALATLRASQAELLALIQSFQSGQP